MKKIAILLIATIPTFSAFSQSAKIVNAKNYLREYTESKDAESLNKAKENIDLASEHVDTKDKPKTQSLKGQIYLAIFDNTLRLETEKLTSSIADPNKRSFAAYQNMNTASLATAYGALVLAKSLDEKGDYKSEINNNIINVVNRYENKAIADYNGKKFTSALESFEKTYEINGEKDTASLANCALVADRAGVYDKAKNYYHKMIASKLGGSETYGSLVNVYLTLKDTVGGMNVLKQGRTAYANDINLLILETNYYLRNNKSEEAIKNLNQAIQAKPNDANLYLARGNMYDNMANPKDATTGRDMEKPKDYTSKFQLAETDYKKAIELKPDFFDAYYNLGALYNNNAVVMAKEADKISDNAKYEIENKKATAEFNKAVPYLEKALELSPNDRSTMAALKVIYLRTQQTDKAKAMTEKLKN